MRIATWNVNSLKARLPRVEEWLELARPDVLCLQETKLADTAFPAMAFSRLGYDAAHHGEGRWNGVAVLSRVGLDDVRPGFDPATADPGDARWPAEIGDEARILSATCGGVRVTSVYVPNGRELGHPQYEYKLAWLARLRRHLAAACSPHDRVVVCGDFNIAPDDRDVWDPGLFVASTHVSEPERRALAELEGWGLVDVLRRRFPDPGLFTYWDYRAGMFHKHQGMRIDLILATRTLAERSTFVVVDRNARKGKQPSDHAPVVADFDI